MTDRPRDRAVKEHVSFRLPHQTVERLDRRARQARESRTSVVERLVEEGLRMDAHPQIVFREGRSGRRPALAGTRLDVWQVLETVRSSAGSVAKAASYLDVPASAVQACVRYYAEFRDEVDVWAERVRALAEEEEHAFYREREVLA